MKSNYNDDDLTQFTYFSGNSWGVDSDGKSCIGCGTQEEFKACADIVIGFLETDTLPPTITTGETLLNFSHFKYLIQCTFTCPDEKQE